MLTMAANRMRSIQTHPSHVLSIQDSTQTILVSIVLSFHANIDSGAAESVTGSAGNLMLLCILHVSFDN